MKHTELKWNAPDGVEIYGQCWHPDTEPKAVICAVHGMGEHSGRYAPMAEFYVNRGFAFIGYDHRGHGKSGGKRGHTPSYEILLEGVTDLLKQADKLFPAVPKFIFGHSMGGNVVLNYALRRHPKVAGIIASAPWLKLAFDPPAFQIALGKFVNKIYPSLTQHTKLDATAISRDKAEVERYMNDPLVHDCITPSFFLGTFEAAEWALDHAADFTLPLLVYHGSGDKLISIEGSRLFCQKAKGDITFKEWEGLYHETHYEKERNEVMTLAAEWAEKHIR